MKVGGARIQFSSDISLPLPFWFPKLSIFRGEDFTFPRLIGHTYQTIKSIEKRCKISMDS